MPLYLWDMVDDNFEIHMCESLRSYKKMIPVFEKLHECSNDYVWLVLCDDDLIFEPDWLSSFNLPQKVHRKAYSHRCHLVKRDINGEYTKYRTWKKNIKTIDDGDEVFATSGAGLAIPLEFVNKYFYKTRDFLDWAPTCDDVWINYMLKYSGIELNHSGYHFILNEWTENALHYNDRLWEINKKRNELGSTPNDIALSVCREGLREVFGH